MVPRLLPRPLRSLRPLVNELLQRWRLCLASLLVFTVFITNNLGLTSAVSSGGWPQVSHPLVAPRPGHAGHAPLVLSTAPPPWWEASHWNIAHPVHGSHWSRHRQYSKRDTDSVDGAAAAVATAARGKDIRNDSANRAAESDTSREATNSTSIASISAQISSILPVPSCNQSLPQCRYHIDATLANCDEDLPCVDSALAATVCTLDAGVRVNRTLFHPEVPSMCWVGAGGCPPPVLSQEEVDHIKSDNATLCERVVNRLLCKIVVVNKKVVNFNSIDNSTNDIATKYNCRDHNSVHECECKEWYLTWLCYSSWPVYYVDGGVETRIPPCLSVCRAVQEFCPFHLLPDESSASGDPSYLCEAEDQFITGTPASPGTRCCYEPLSLNSSHNFEDPVSSPQEGAWVNLNATCSSLAPSWPSSCDTAAPDTAGLPHSTAPAIGLPRFAAPSVLPVLANRTLLLRLRDPRLPELSWFWDLVSSSSRCVTRDLLVHLLCVLVLLWSHQLRL